MPSRNTYSLTWVSFTLDVGYLFTAAPAKCSPAPYLGHGVAPLSRACVRGSRRAYIAYTGIESKNEWMYV